MTIPEIALFGLACVLLAASVEASGVDFYVATNGSDSWTGALPAPNRSRTDGPFATLNRARDAVRSLKDPAARATVQLRKGAYFLNDTFTLGPQDTHPVTYTSYKGEKVTVSGGRPITGFTEVEVNGKKMLAAQIPEVKAGKWNFTQLFVNDRRRPRTRLPKKDYYRIADLPDVAEGAAWSTGQDKFKFNPGEIDAAWRNLTDVDIISLSLWVESREQIKSVEVGQHIVHLNKRSVFWMWDDFKAKLGARYWVENLFEALDTPGQWYLDRPTGTLYYYPLPGEDARKLRVVAPKLEQLVKVGVGLDAKQSLSDIAFTNLSFAHTEPTHPAERGGYSQAAVGVPGAISFERTKNATITNCEISGIGTYAVDVGAGCEGIHVEKNRIADMGAGGVKVQPESEGTVIADNDIGDGGKIFMSAVGVWIGNSPNNTVSHNHIHDMDYTGVSMGWTWGYGETKTKNNVVEFNHIHHVGRTVLSDLGGIYTLGTQPNSVLRNNLIHDSYCNTYGGWGIYTDEGSSQILIENNVVYNTATGGFHQHYGKENTLRNNIFAFGRDQQIQRTRPEEHKGFYFNHNIVYYDQGNLLGGNLDKLNCDFDYNVYWDAHGKPVTFVGGETFADWQKKGYDAHGLVADPLFADAKKRDFRLKPESPALKLGFKQIDVSTVGPRCPVGPIR